MCTYDNIDQSWLDAFFFRYNFFLLDRCLIIIKWFCRSNTNFTSFSEHIGVYLALVPAGNRLTALMRSWRSSSFQPFPPTLPPPPLAWSAPRAACLAWTSASFSFCSCTFTSSTWRVDQDIQKTPSRYSSWLASLCFFTCFTTAALLSSLEDEAKTSFRDCRLEIIHLYKSVFSLTQKLLLFLKRS